MQTTFGEPGLQSCITRRRAWFHGRLQQFHRPWYLTCKLWIDLIFMMDASWNTVVDACLCLAFFVCALYGELPPWGCRHFGRCRKLLHSQKLFELDIITSYHPLSACINHLSHFNNMCIDPCTALTSPRLVSPLISSTYDQHSDYKHPTNNTNYHGVPANTKLR